MKKTIFLILMMLIITFNAIASNPTVLNLATLLELAESNSELISVEKFNELVAKEAITVARAGFFPTLSFEAIDTTGFPGSSNFNGMRGLMNSPFRKGVSAGIKSEATVWDFGRTTNAVKSAQFQSQYAKENTKVTAFEVKKLALQVYYECSFYKSQAKLWKKLNKESELINHEALRFVNTGQRSIVDKYISQAQMEDAYTKQKYFEELLKGSMVELSIITGLRHETFSCPYLKDSIDGMPKSDFPKYESPYISRAKIGVEVARSELKKEKANFMPEFLFLGSLGGMQGVNVDSIEKENFAVGLAVTLPIYNMAFFGRIKEAEAEYGAQQKEVEAQQQYVDEMNAKYNESINAILTKIQYLTTELKNAQEGYKIAKQRYFSLETDLYDVQAMYQIISRVENELRSSQTLLLRSVGEHALFNGAPIVSVR